MRARKCLCILLAAALLCGCSALRENNDISDLPSLEPQQNVPSGSYAPYRATLYYLDAQRNTLSTEIREIELVTATPKAVQIFEALVAGPQEKGLSGFGSDYGLKNVEITGGIANIYLTTVLAPNDQRKLFLCAALANTAVDNLGVRYANIFINGAPVYAAGRPCGLLGKTDLDMTSFYDSYMARAAEPTWTIPVALYFLDDSRSYIVPEARIVTFEGENYLEEVLYQLSLGPAHKEYLTSPVLPNFEFTYGGNPAGIQGGVLYVDSVQRLFPSQSNTAMRQYMACLYYSFHGVTQGLNGMEFSRGPEKHNVTFSISQLYLGEEIVLYFPGKDLKHLECFRHVVRAGRAQALNTYIEELAAGPLASEAVLALACFPADMGLEGMLGIEMRGNVALVNFSAEMLYSLEGFREEELNLFLYSIVNTLCEVEAVHAVQFCFEGEIIDELGRFSLAMPLLPNIGLAK